VHESFREIVDMYDAFILDQFGVLHDGTRALDGAVECVEYLAATAGNNNNENENNNNNKNKKRLVILSNTSAPSDKALERLPKFGFKSQHFVGAVTSGEEAARYVREAYNDNDDNNDEKRPYKALFLTWDFLTDQDNPRLTAHPDAFLDRCGPDVELACDVEKADFLLLHGSESWYRKRKGNDDGVDVDKSANDGDTGGQPVLESLGTFIETGRFDDEGSMLDGLLKECAARKLPMVCANPDFVVQTPDGGGGVAYMPGRIAQRYRELLLEVAKEETDGLIRIFGKPGVEHFEACLRILGYDKDDESDRLKVAHVGDSLHHDVAGAARAGIPTVFVTSGIHSSQLKQASYGELPSREALQQLFEEEGIAAAGAIPTHVVSAFRL